MTILITIGVFFTAGAFFGAMMMACVIAGGDHEDKDLEVYHNDGK